MGHSPRKDIVTDSGRLTDLTLSMMGLTIIFANSLDPDQGRQKVGPDLDPKRLTPLIVVMKDSYEKINYKKSADEDKITKSYPVCKAVVTKDNPRLSCTNIAGEVSCFYSQVLKCEWIFACLRKCTLLLLGNIFLCFYTIMKKALFLICF